MAKLTVQSPDPRDCAAWPGSNGMENATAMDQQPGDRSDPESEEALRTLLKRLDDLNQWARRLEEEAPAGHESHSREPDRGPMPPAVPGAPPIGSKESDVRAAGDAGRRAKQVLQAAQRHGGWLLAQAEAANNRRYDEALALAVDLRKAVQDAVDRMLVQVESANAAHLESANAEGRAVMEFATERVTTWLGSSASIPTPPRLGAAPSPPASGEPLIRSPILARADPPEKMHEPEREARPPTAAAPAVQTPAASSNGHSQQTEAVNSGTSVGGTPALEWAEAENPWNIELVARPFTRFAQLAQFNRALGTLSGVHSVTADGFEHGTVRLLVRYDHPIPLRWRLAELEPFSITVVDEAPRRLELEVVPKGDSV